MLLDQDHGFRYQDLLVTLSTRVIITETGTLISVNGFSQEEIIWIHVALHYNNAR